MGQIELDDVEQLDVNGGVVLLPSKTQWEQLLSGATMGGRKVFMPDAVKKQFEFIDTENSIKMALVSSQCRGSGGAWLTILLFKRNNGQIQRGVLNGVKCDNCGTAFYSVDPTIIDLYVCTHDSETNMHAAWEMVRSEQPRCPVCGANFIMPTLYVWRNATVPSMKGHEKNSEK